MIKRKRLRTMIYFRPYLWNDQQVLQAMQDMLHSSNLSLRLPEKRAPTDLSIRVTVTPWAVSCVYIRETANAYP